MKLFSIYLVFALMLTGCVEPSLRSNERPVGYVGKDTKLEMNSIRVLDKNLIDVEEKQFLGKIGPINKQKKTKIVIENHTLSYTKTGLKEVIVSIRNQTDYPLRVKGKVSWFDQNELPLSGNNNGWEALFLQPKSVRIFRQNSTNENAAFYVVDLME